MAKSIIHEKSFHSALEVIELYKKLRAEREYVLSKQLFRSGTGIGANVEEAIAGFKANPVKNTTVLIPGSRGLALERLAELF